jgi:hypothetical protein
VQGNTCQEWTKEELGKIKTTIDQCLKLGNPKLTIDTEIRKLTLPCLQQAMLRNTEDADDLDTSETFVKTVGDNENLHRDSTTKQIPKSNKEKSNLVSDSPKKDTFKQSKPILVHDETAHKSDSCTNCSKIVEAIHSIENKLADCHAMYAHKIETLEMTVTDLKKTIENLKVEKEVIQVNTDNIQKMCKEIADSLEKKQLIIK